MKLLVVSNMYPNEKFPSYGIFVKNFCQQLEELEIQYSLSVMQKSVNKLSKIFNYFIFYCKTFLTCIFVNFDIIYIHYASHSSLPVIAASKFRKLNIYTNVHGSDVVPENANHEKMQKYTKKILAKSSKIITPSKYFKEYVQTKYKVPPTKVFISHSGGVDKNIFYQENKETPYTSKLRIGFVSRISYKKGWDILLDACALLENGNYELVIVGNGPEIGAMQKKIKEKHLSEYITYYDLLPQDELRKIYNEIDVLVFPTEREGESLGLIAIEALACGTPVIASDYAAPSYYIVDGYNGFKFKKGDATQLAEKLDMFSSLPIEKRNQLITGAVNSSKKYEKEQVKKEIKYIITGNLND